MNGQLDLTSVVKQSDHLTILRYIRAQKLHEPQLVVHHGTQLFGQHLDKLSNSGAFCKDDSERLETLEQICIASTHLQKVNLAEVALSQIQRAVGKESMRYRRLLALCLESQESFDAANEMYDDLLRENPSNTLALKRKYCILAAQKGMEEESREVLNAYLERSGNDIGAWTEMAKVCGEIGDYAGAAYCYEEIVLSSPLNPDVHCKLAEWYATLGGSGNLKLARKHFSQSLELAPNNLRAMYGLVNTTDQRNLKRNKKDNEHELDAIELSKDLYKYGELNLRLAYKTSNLSSVVSSVFED